MALLEGLDLDHTIAAISTPIGMGGIGVIRLSGSKAHEICKNIFVPKLPSTSLKHRMMILGDVVDLHHREVVDEVFAIFMFAPSTYTRENMAEIQCHSGRVVLERILKLLLENGARLAGPGEFTLRAFLNGRIDLTQAEGVIEVIQAQSEASLRMAQKQLHGGIGKAINSLLQPVNQILMYMEADLDFSEDTGIDFNPTWQALWNNAFPEVMKEIERLMEGHATCQMVREGFEVVIVGMPNVGKSSILNRFVGKDRAIVTEVPGTTRDFIEEGILIKGIPFRIVDTAGLRSSRDPAERIGTKHALRKKRQADIVLLVVDRARPLAEEEVTLLKEAEEGKTIVVLNKCDLSPGTSPGSVTSLLPEEIPVVEISAKTGQNWNRLIHALVAMIQNAEALPDNQHLIPINQRHYQLLKKAKTALERFGKGYRNGVEEVFLSQDLWEAKRALEAIIGKVPDGDILSEIFRNFCIGK